MALVAIGAVLRLWNLGRLHLDFDEAFTATAARLPVGRLFSFLRADDAHPPLDYLLRRPAALHGASEAVLRLPSAVLSIGALGAFAAWMRHRQLLGVLATAVLAVAAFQLTYAQDARMYAGMVTVGVVASWSADSCLHSV